MRAWGFVGGNWGATAGRGAGRCRAAPHTGMEKGFYCISVRPTAPNEGGGGHGRPFPALCNAATPQHGGGGMKARPPALPPAPQGCCGLWGHRCRCSSSASKSGEQTSLCFTWPSTVSSPVRPSPMPTDTNSWGGGGNRGGHRHKAPQSSLGSRSPRGCQTPPPSATPAPHLQAGVGCPHSPKL